MSPKANNLLPDWVRYLSGFLATSGAYWIFAKLGLIFATINHNASPFWPASGLALGLVFLRIRFAAAGIFVGALLANATTGASLVAVLLIAAGNALESIIGAHVLKYFQTNLHPDESSLGNRGPTTTAILLASCLGALVSATVGSSALLLTQGISSASFTIVWLTWWGGDVVGGLLLIPVIISFYRRKQASNDWKLSRALTAIILYVVSVVIVFGLKDGGSAILLLFMPIPVLAWALPEFACFCFTLMTAILTVFAAADGRGAFVDLHLNDNLIGLQLMLGSMAIATSIIKALSNKIRIVKMMPILGFGWLLSGLLFWSFHRRHTQDDEKHFNGLVEERERQIAVRFETIVSELYGAAGFMSGKDRVTRAQWRTFYHAARLDQVAAGLEAVGVVVPIQKRDLQAFESSQRDNLAPEFQLHGFDGRPHFSQTSNEPMIAEEFVVQFVEPLASNRSALGVILSANDDRRDALLRAKTRGKPALTRPVQLIQDKQRRQSLILYVPYYSSINDGPVYVERGTEHVGWISGVFILEKLMGQFFYGEEDELSLSVSEKSDGVHDDLHIYESHGRISVGYLPLRHGTSVLVRPFELADRTFYGHWKRGPGFKPSKDFTLAWIGAFGVILTLAITQLFAASLIYRVESEAEIKSKTAELVRKKRLWRTLTEQAPVGIFRVSRALQPDYANPTWINLLGYDPLTVTSEKRWTSIYPADATAVKEAWMAATASEGPFRMEFRLLDREGKIRWIDMHAAPILDEEGPQDGYVGIAIDVTDVKQREQEIDQERAKAMQSAKMAALGEMAAGIAHEINNPLAIINAVTAHLLVLKPPMTTEVIDEVKRIEETSLRISKIVRGLRLFSRDSERDPFAPVSFASVVSETLAMCRERFTSKGVKLEVKEIPPVIVMCRGSQLSQLLLNLLNNAFDAASESPTPEVWLHGWRNTEHIFIAVDDSGPGVDPEVESRIMQPFFSTKPVGKGTGLGLSISSGIAQDHGGSLSYSRVAGRTRFTFELPIAGLVTAEDANYATTG